MASRELTYLLRHLLVHRRFYQGKPEVGRFPLVSEWIYDSKEEKGWYAVQLRASLVGRPYTFRLIDTNQPDMGWPVDDCGHKRISIGLGWSRKAINHATTGETGYCLEIEDTTAVRAGNCWGIYFGLPARLLLYDWKATGLMDHDLFSVIQVINALGAEIYIQATEEYTHYCLP